MLRHYRARPARLHEFERAFLHESKKRWGTAERPCPILGLAHGGECWGLAFEVPQAERRAVGRVLARREAAAERRLATRTVETPEGPVAAWVSLSRVTNGSGRIDLDTVEVRLRAAHGVVGTGVEYVRTLVHAMELHGIRDPLIETLWARLRE